MSDSSTNEATAGRTTSGGRRRLSRHVVVIVLLVIAACVYTADQISKHWAEANLPLLQPQPLIGELLQLRLLYNSGAAFGLGSGITPVVTCLQVAIGIGVVVFAVWGVRSPWYTLALGLVLGGALGNVHDRLLRPPSPFRGEVVDFLELPNWPVFNVADMAVVAGAVLIMLLSILGHPSDPAAVDDAEQAGSDRTDHADDAVPEDDAR